MKIYEISRFQCSKLKIMVYKFLVFCDVSFFFLKTLYFKKMERKIMSSSVAARILLDEIMQIFPSDMELQQIMMENSSDFPQIMLTDVEIEYLTFVANSLDIKHVNNMEVLIGIQKAFDQSAEPSVYDVSKHILLSRQCNCTDGYDMKQLVPSLSYILCHLEIVALSCGNIKSVVEFDVMHHRFPDISELRQYFSNLNHMNRDMDDYCNNKRHLVPAGGLKYISPVAFDVSQVCSMLTLTNEQRKELTEADNPLNLLNDWKIECNLNCGICQDEITFGSNIIRLPQCKHCFHAEGKNCLGEGASIVTWLNQSKKCPLCSTDVSFTPEKKRTSDSSSDSDDTKSQKKTKSK